MAQLFRRSFRSSIAPTAAWVAVGCLLLGACSDDDHACDETKSCAPNDRDGGAGTAGRDAGSAARDGGAGTADDGSVASGGSGVDTGVADTGVTLDTTPPTVVSIMPEDGAKGVLKDTNIVITFSEPMNQLSAQAAYQSADIPAANVVFTWNAEGTVLTLNPNADLAYATGVAPATTVALVFSIALTTTAMDRAGNGLANDQSTRFTTLRRIRHRLTLPDGKGQSIAISGGVQSCPAVVMLVGDGNTNLQGKTIMTFDITDYPAGIVAFESSTLTAEQRPLVAPNGLGNLLIEHTNLGSVDLAAFSGSALRSLGIFSADNNPGAKSGDVLVAVKDDYAHRSERANQSQYRFAYEVGSDGDGTTDLMTFLCDPAPTLECTYLVP